jgi:type II secretion system protein H
MPTSAIGTPRSNADVRYPAHAATSGFTLLELLVVIVIVGIIAAMATLNIGVATRDRGSQKEIERLAELLKTASEEAQMHGREFGLNFYAHQYEVIAFDPASESWEPLEDEDPFKPRHLAESGVVDLQIEGHVVRLAEEPALRKPAKPLAPAKPAPVNNTNSADSADNLLDSADSSDSATAERAKDKKDKQATEKKDPGPSPQILILSSDYITPFVIRYRSAIGEPAIRLTVTDNGEISTARDDL